MASTTEVTRLRKEGRIEEAYTMASALMAAQPDDIWVRRAFAWAVYAMVKSKVEQRALQEAQELLAQFDELNMPPEEQMLHDSFDYFRLQLHPAIIRARALSDEERHPEALRHLWELFEREERLRQQPALHTQIAWETWHSLKSLSEPSAGNVKLLEKWLNQYRQLNLLPKPGLPHSVVLNQVLHLPPELRETVDMLDWFRFWKLPEHLSEKDWLPYAAGEVKAPSLAERACNAWCRAMIQKGRSLPPEELSANLDTLASISTQHPDFVWLPYFLAKIRIDATPAAPATVREGLLPFIRKKHTDFWAWDLLADTCDDAEPDQKEACLCKALTCRTEPQFLTKVRLRLIRILIKKGDYDRARYEIEQVENLKTRRKETMPPEIRTWKLTDGIREAALPEPEAQQQYYAQKAVEAEALVFGDTCLEGTGVIEGIDANTGTVFFALSQEARGRFSGERYRKWTFQTGDLFHFKVLKVDQAGKTFWKVLSIGPPTGLPPEDLYRLFNGPFRKSGAQPFGFVDQAFVPPSLAASHKLQAGQDVWVSAIWAFDPKKKQFGWKAVKVV